MKVVTHKYKTEKGKLCYAVNLVDYNNRPLETHIVTNPKDKVEKALTLAYSNKVEDIFHNTGFSLIQ
tara:strand:+ start:649 stop:849 length:201 start_codon:yes stop_codon:yes gene_type:complete